MSLPGASLQVVPPGLRCFLLTVFEQPARLSSLQYHFRRHLVLVCSKRRAPRSVHCICCFLTNRLLTTWGQLRKRKFTYAKGRCLLVRESAKSCHEERWTSSTKQRVPNTSFPAKRAVIEFWSVL